MNKDNTSKENKLKTLIKGIINECKAELYYPKYPIINEAHSYGGAFRVAKLGDIIASPEKCILSEGVDWDVEQNLKGGIIVFSTDVNALILSPNKIMNYLRQKVATIKNRFTATRKIDKIANKNELVGWTIGHYLDGRYKAKNGQNFGENSLSVELIGIDEDKLIDIAETICRDFQQESVLVKSYSTGRILFVNPD